MRCASSRAIASPRPDPEAESLVWKRSKTAREVAAPDPGPVVGHQQLRRCPAVPGSDRAARGDA